LEIGPPLTGIHRPVIAALAAMQATRIVGTRRSKLWWGVKRRPEGSRMTRKTSLILLGAAVGVAVTLVTTQSQLLFDGTHAQAAAADGYRKLSLFGDVFERVRADYVEKPDDGRLIQSAINGMLAGLDPHSSYMDSKRFRNMQAEIRGEFGGLGIEMTMEEGLIKVVAPIDETPATKAGIMANDIITHLDEKPVRGLTFDQVVEKIRGRVNTKIKLTIMRNGQDKPVEVSIMRKLIRDARCALTWKVMMSASFASLSSTSRPQIA
jgi:carboxyl-terminal processing protease